MIPDLFTNEFISNTILLLFLIFHLEKYVLKIIAQNVHLTFCMYLIFILILNLNLLKLVKLRGNCIYLMKKMENQKL